VSVSTCICNATSAEHGVWNRYLTFDDPEHIHLDRCVYSVVDFLCVNVITPS